MAIGPDPDAIRKNVNDLRKNGHTLDSAIGAAMRQARLDHKADEEKRKKAKGEKK